MKRRAIVSGLRKASNAANVALTATSLCCAGAFTARRWAHLLGASLPATRVVFVPPADHTPRQRVLLLVPFRDEATRLPALLTALAQLTFPASCLQLGLVDDGSRDGGADLARAWCAAGPNRRLLTRPISGGKAAALNAALRQWAFGDIVAVYDADERPRPDVLDHLCAALADPTVAAVSGRRRVSNGDVSRFAAQAALEAVVYQRVTVAGRDALRLAPPILGSNCAYRRAALATVGGFREGALLEDGDLTVRLARAGHRLRYCPAAISDHDAPATAVGYWRQRVRWSSGFQQIAADHAPALLGAARRGASPSLPPPRRFELLAHGAGYLDRVALCWLLGRRRNLGVVGRLILGLAVLTPLAQIGTGLKLARADGRLWRQALWQPLFLPLDALIAVVGAGRAVVGRLPRWERRAAPVAAR